MNNIKEYIYDELLQKVEKPGRYIGTEWNSVHKTLEEINIRFAFCFPDVYEVGMSHLGMRILYHLLNDQQDVYCERVFAPWTDMENEMRKEKIKLFALESRDFIDTFDFLGFTLQYEMSYTNILNMLDLAGIPLKAADRKDKFPFVMAGGPCAYNPEPLADIVDFFVLGEGEEVTLDIMAAYRSWQAVKGIKEEFLYEVSKIKGVYVPSLYNVIYNDDNTVKEVTPIKEGVPVKISKRIVKDMETAYFPEKVIVPFIDIVHDRIMLEIFRGCTRGCRFCQAGIIYRPVRERSLERLMEIADKLIQNTGYEEISLSSLSSTDYSRLTELVAALMSKYQGRKVNLTLPSLRIDHFSMELVKQIQKVRKSSLTFAPEAGTQRMRDIINKGVDEEDVINTTGLAFENGYNSVKLYFMIGLPFENMDDIMGIADLGLKVCDRYYQIPKDKRPKGLSVNVSTSCFVPKPFTPFQWEPQDSVESLREKQRFLQRNIKRKQIVFNWHDPNVSFLEGIFARGDRRLGQVLIKAWENGCKFDGWDQFFNFTKWMQSFEEGGIDPNFYTARKRSLEEVLPWDHIDVGVSKAYLKKEYEKAELGELTQDCRVSCTGCGMSITEDGGICL